MIQKTKNSIFICIMLIFTLLFSSCSYNNISHTLLLSGDVNEWVNVDEFWSDIEKVSFQYDGKKHRGIALQSLIEMGGINSNDYAIFLKANDGYMIKIDSSSIDATYITYSKEFGFHFLSDKHPVNSKVKFIDEIIVKQHYDEFSVPDVGIHIISYEKQLHKSIGELLSSSYEILPYQDGSTSQDNISIDILKQKKVIKLSALWSDEIESILVMDSAGHHEYLYETNGYFEIGNNQINFFTDNKNQYYRDIEGIIVNPPFTSVMDTFYDCTHYLKNDVNVLLLFIDGLSYSQYEYILYNYPQLFLSQINDTKTATTVFKPVTNAGFAAMITGKPPSENGIFNRDYRQLMCPTLFDFANDANISSLLIDGNTKILNTDCEIILNNDSNNDGYTDDEIFNCGLDSINSNYNFMLVHFHSIDDAGHNNGPFDIETINRIKVIDEYVNELATRWNGKVIITADHGMHETSAGGNHGEFRFEDMYIPYMIIDGGKYEE